LAKAEEKENLRAHGRLKVWETGHAFFPESLRRELGIDKDRKIPYFVNANTVTLIREGATKEEVIRGLKILLQDIDLRWKEEGEEGQGQKPTERREQ